MILVVNCIADLDERRRFERRVVPRLAALTSAKLEHVTLDELGTLTWDPRWTHLLLSGSELSASRRYPTDDALLALIREADACGRAVLGICYGHQMIARALAGDACCRRARVPEFGFRTLALEANPLFVGIEKLTPVHSHYDEVTGLPENRFATIASTPDCPVQAFQLRGRPVWGVQFHPELDVNAARKMAARNLETEAAAKDHYFDELEDPGDLDAGARIFENFFATAPVEE